MLRKSVGVFIISGIFTCILSAELNWGKPQPIQALTGYIDSYAVAMNRHGHAIAVLGDKVFGAYDMYQDRWMFVQLDCTSGHTPVLTHYTGEAHHQFPVGKPSKGTIIALGERDEGLVVFTIPQGVYKGRIAVLDYTSKGWGSVTVLSEAVGGDPALARGYDGRALVVWINKDEQSDAGSLMGAYYDGTNWVRQGVISTRTSVEMDYNQIGPQIVMSDLGDAVVVWKVVNTNSEDNSSLDQQSVLIAQYFDGVEEKWSGEEVVGVQPMGKQGRDLAISVQGEALLVWDHEEGIESAYMDLMQYMIYYQSSIANDSEGPKQSYSWHTQTIAQGEELNTPKLCMDLQGNALAVWLQGYSGISSAYFDIAGKMWKVIPEPLTSNTAYVLALRFDGAKKCRSVWVGEGVDLSEVLYSRCFDFDKHTWSLVELINAPDLNSLLDGVEAFSIGQSNAAIMMWYDFFQEKLFYSVFKDRDKVVEEMGIQPSGKKSRREGFLYQKKAELSRRRIDRARQGR